MWIPYDLKGMLKPESAADTIDASQSDNRHRELLVGFFVRNPVTQSWEVDVRVEPIRDGLHIALQGRAAQIAFYGDAAGRLNEVVYHVSGNDPVAALSLCYEDMERRLARWALELGRGMAIAAWRVADPAHRALWRCTPFRPSALDLEKHQMDGVPDELAPLVRLYHQARNTTDAAWRLLCASAVLKAWERAEPPFAGIPAPVVTLEMLVLSGAHVCAAELRDRPVQELVALLEPERAGLMAGLSGAPGWPVPDLAAQARLSQLANLADIAARTVLMSALSAIQARRKLEVA